MHPNPFNNHIESLRGFMAVIVVIHHLSNLGKNIDPAFVPSWIELLNLPGHIAVLVFFVLSGYLIGLTNKSQMKLSGVLPYLKKRVVRLYPIYALVIALTLIFVKSNYPFSQIAANFTFLQVMFSPVIDGNLPIWSLHYEVIYYLLFIVVSLLGLKPILLMVIMVITGIVNFFIFPDIALISSLSFGFCFWLAGLAMAHYIPNKKDDHEVNYSILLSSIFLLLALDGYNVLTTIFHYVLQNLCHNNFAYLSSNYLYARVVPLIDLSLLPYCAIFVALFAGLKSRHYKIILLTLQLLPLMTLKAIFFPKVGRDVSVYILPSICYALSLLLFFAQKLRLEKFLKVIIDKMAFLGSISFGIYIIHHPIIELVKRIPFPSGNLLTYILRIGVVLTLTIIISYILELRYQPFIKKYLVKNSQVQR